MADGWICDECGEVATGAMCMACGNQRHLEAPPGPRPGSYYSIVGLHNLAGFKFYGWFVALMVGIAVIFASAVTALLILIAFLVLLALVPWAVMALSLWIARVRRR